MGGVPCGDRIRPKSAATLAHTEDTHGGASAESRYGPRVAGTADGGCENSYAAFEAPWALTAAMECCGVASVRWATTKSVLRSLVRWPSHMVRFFISGLDTYLGAALIKRLSSEDGVQIVGTVTSADAAPSKAARVLEVSLLFLPKHTATLMVVPHIAFML